MFAVTLPREASSIPVTRRIVGCVLAELGVDDDCISDVEVAVTEACTNVLKHADGATSEYEVEVTITHAQIGVRIKDGGRGFDNSALKAGHSREVDLDIAQESGRGIALMRALVDNVQFLSRPEAGTIVHLTKRRDSTADSDMGRVGAGRVQSRNR